MDDGILGLFDQLETATYAERMRMLGLCVGCGTNPDFTHYTKEEMLVWDKWGWCKECASTLDEAADIQTAA